MNKNAFIQNGDKKTGPVWELLLWDRGEYMKGCRSGNIMYSFIKNGKMRFVETILEMRV
jgi:hypothetical protein